MSREYNGHHCWNCWNVALWIGNDEPLYRAALDCIQRPRVDGRVFDVIPSMLLALVCFVLWLLGILR